MNDDSELAALLGASSISRPPLSAREYAREYARDYPREYPREPPREHTREHSRQYQDEPSRRFDVLPRLHHHHEPSLKPSFKLEPSMDIDVRDSARVFEVYHKLDERWRANLTQQALGSAHVQDDMVSSVTFLAEERFLHFAGRLNVKYRTVAELKGFNDRQMREALQINGSHEPAFVTELKEVCSSVAEMLPDEEDEEDEDEHKKRVFYSKSSAWSPKYFKACVNAFSQKLTLCIQALDDVVNAAYLMKISHMAQLKALDVRYRDEVASARAIARASHHNALRGWSKGVVDSLMAWADRLSPFVSALRAHIMGLGAFIQGTLNILHYHQMHVSEGETRGVAPQLSGPLSLDTLRRSSQQWMGFIGAVVELLKIINNRASGDAPSNADTEEALQVALLQENPNPADSCTDAFNSMRFYLCGKSLVQPIKALTEKVASAAKELNPALVQYKQETERLFQLYSAETEKQERRVAELDKSMRVLVEESSYHSNQTSRLKLFQQGNIDLNIKLMSQIEALKPELARENSTLKDLRDSFSIMAELHKSCQNKLPLLVQFDKFQFVELKLVEELKDLSAHVTAGYRSVTAQSFASAKAASASLFEDAGHDSKNLASDRDKIFEDAILDGLKSRLNFALPNLKELQTHILQLCRHFNSDFLSAQIKLSEVDLDINVTNYTAMRLNMIIAMHIYEYAVEVGNTSHF